MDFTTYFSLFEKILNNQLENASDLYKDPDFLEYTKLNQSRVNRWMKTGVLLEETKSKIKAISEPQQWIVITEHWCGDASHIVPFIELISKENSLITVQYELRDSAPNRIENYLTNGSKSIPILIVKNEKGEDLLVWGPRPKACQDNFMMHKNSGMELKDLKLELQKWYNEDKGVQIQKEIIALL